MPKKLPVVTDCDGCDVCCRHMGYPTFIFGSETQVDEEPWIRLPQELRSSLLSSIDSYRSRPEGELDGPCLWLETETGYCKHHEFRPNVCRDFRVGSPDCLDWRAEYLVSCSP